MKKFTIIILGLLLGASSIFAQEEKTKDRPVRQPFESSVLIDMQTVQIPYKGTLMFNIEHRFGTMDNGITDLYGVYAPSNIRLALNYSLMNNLVVGYGTTKDQKLQDFQVKWTALQQTRKNTVPVGVALYGNMAIDARESDVFGKHYELTNRFSYFAQLIISRKIGYAVALQVAPSFSHINSVQPGYEHDRLAIAFSGKINVSPQSSIIFQYETPLEIEGMYENLDPIFKPKDNFGIGWEISTSTHAFQMFISTARSLVPQYNVMYNDNDWTDGQVMLGFNITRLWSF